MGLEPGGVRQLGTLGQPTALKVQQDGTPSRPTLPASGDPTRTCATPSAAGHGENVRPGRGSNAPTFRPETRLDQLGDFVQSDARSALATHASTLSYHLTQHFDCRADFLRELRRAERVETYIQLLEA